MFDFLKKNKDKKMNNYKLLINTTALLIHAAKIDENYTNNEKNLIKKTLYEQGINQESIDELFNKAENAEKNSNQILEFTREIKNADEKFKIKIIETLWSIIYSDNISNIYESNFMRRLTGLLYLDNKLVGNIKEKVRKKIKK